ncbi:MAG: electron transport complex subunit RsxC [Clostridiales bacterium]|nr:electron transport complex subunit RsxC [Clostridiales bacterium]
MKLKALINGISVYEGKELSADCAVKTIKARQNAVYPLYRGMGKPSSPAVSPGDRVLKGQLIANADGFTTSPAHSAVSGTVKKIEKRTISSGIVADCIVIENDGADETVQDYGKERDYKSLSQNEITEVIKESGIVGLGGAGFPTSVKLSPKNISEIDYLIINGCECEPYLTSDYRLMAEKTDEIITGINIVLRLLPNAKAIVAIENNKSDVYKMLCDKTANNDKISACELKTKYPQGGERQLIYAVTGRKLNSRTLPAQKGCIVLNVSTCFAIYEAVCRNIPLIHKIITVTGDGANSPCNLDVPIGMSYSEILEEAGGAKEEAVKYISGGPMMGTALSSLDVPTEKNSSALLIFTKDDVAVLNPSNCIHCGKCLTVCPELLVPQMMAKAVKSDDFENFKKLGGMECVECGCCTYICPAKIPLTQLFKYGKAAVRKSAAKKG